MKLYPKLLLTILTVFPVLFLAAAPLRADVLVVAYMDEAKVALVDSRTFETVVLLDTGKNPHEVRVSPDKRSAYVAAGKTVTVIDLKNRTVRANFDLGEYSAHDIRISRDNRRIWLACAAKESILEVDAATGKVLQTYKVNQPGAWFVEVTPDERKLYTPNLEGKSVSVITRATGEVKIIPFDNPVYGIDVTPDGKQVWVSSGADVAVLDTVRDKVIATIKTSEAEAGRLRIARDGKHAVVALSKKLAIYDARTRRLVREADLAAEPKVLTLSSDNRRAFLTNPADNSVTVVDLAAGKQTKSFATGKKPDGIGWAD